MGEACFDKRATVALRLNEDTGKAWFKQTGGVAPAYVDAPPSHGYLSQAEREEFLAGLVRGEPISVIAQRMGRHRSTLYRELQRNRPPESRTRPGEEVRIQDYQPSLAQRRADLKAARPKPAKLATNQALRDLVERKLHERLSPQQISAELRSEFPDHPEMWVSHEAIYQSIRSRQRRPAPGVGSLPADRTSPAQAPTQG